MAVTSFIPTLWSARLQHAMDKAHIASNLVNTDYEGEIKNKGDKVKINSIGNITIRDYTKSQNITVDDLDTTDDTLEITEAKYFAFKVDDVDAVQAAGDLVDAAMGRAAYGLADASDAYILGVIAAAGIANPNVIGSDTAPVELSATNVYQKIVEMRTAMDKANVPTVGRQLVVTPEVYALLLLDERFTKVDGVAVDTIKNGFVGRVAGFDVYESNNVTKVTKQVSDQNVVSNVITASVPQATTYAEQIVKTEAYRPEGGFKDAVKGLHVYGAKVTQANGIVAMYVKA